MRTKNGGEAAHEPLLTQPGRHPLPSHWRGWFQSESVRATEFSFILLTPGRGQNPFPRAFGVARAGCRLVCRWRKSLHSNTRSDPSGNRTVTGMAFSRRFRKARKSSDQHPTSDIRHPTPSIEHDSIRSPPHWELDVGCSALDVLLLLGSGCAGLRESPRLLPASGARTSAPSASVRKKRGNSENQRGFLFVPIRALFVSVSDFQDRCFTEWLAQQLQADGQLWLGVGG